ncbi:MAG: putative esterase YcpF (UPF0227 family) [Alteromonadaceae bacterium]|jgi:predicted esterase YcpF (UPF0227 family)
MGNVLYIHGFNSSPLSTKAMVTQAYLAKNLPDIRFHCPQIASKPNAAIDQLEKIIAQYPNDKWYLIGSSLGGYFATYLSEKYNFEAVLINPAVKPYELLSDYLGEQLNPYTHEVYTVEKSYLKDLIRLEQKKIRKNNYMVMVQTGDEVLDYQQTVEKYQDCNLIVQAGGDHSFVNYAQVLTKMMHFFQLA